MDTEKELERTLQREREAFFGKAFHALRFNQIPGDYAEFGCGESYVSAYRQSRRVGFDCMLWGFDSFEGLPAAKTPEDRHCRWQQGSMARSLEEFTDLCDRSAIAPEARRLVPGFFDDTIGPASDLRNQPGGLPERISLAYIDCDLYSSTATVLEFLAGRIAHGTILAFDDYYCYSEDASSGERLAMLDFLTANQHIHLLPFLQFSWHAMSFVVEERERMGERELGQGPSH